MSNHSFDTKIAARVGVNAAIIYNNILWWTLKNATNRKHFHDGLWWSYNSRRAFSEQFEYLTVNQVRTALDKLVDIGLIKKGNYNRLPADKTGWYAATVSSEWPQTLEKTLGVKTPTDDDPVKTLGVKTPTHRGKNPNPLGKKPQALPDIKPDIKPDKKDSVSEFDQFLEISPSKEGLVKARVAFKEAREKVSFETLIDSMQAYREACEREKTKPRYILHPANWLIDERWTDKPDQARPQALSQKSAAISAATLKYYADILNGNEPIHPSLISSSLADELYQSGQVTAQRLRERLPA